MEEFWAIRNGADVGGLKWLAGGEPDQLIAPRSGHARDARALLKLWRTFITKANSRHHFNGGSGGTAIGTQPYSSGERSQIDGFNGWGHRPYVEAIASP